MHFLSDKPPSPNNPANFEPTLNGIVYVVYKIIRNIMASAAEAELGDLFLNCQEAVPIRITLEEMGHPQPRTPVQFDNSTALGIATGIIKQRKSKAMDMRLYWIRDYLVMGFFSLKNACRLLCFVLLGRTSKRHHCGPIIPCPFVCNGWLHLGVFQGS